MFSVLITGANQGIGLGLVRQFLTLAEPPNIIIATCLNISQSDELVALSKTDKQVKILELDVTETSSLEKFVKNVEALLNGNGLNILVNNAGIARKHASFLDAAPEDYLETYAVNVVGPAFVTKALLPLLVKASVKEGRKPLCARRAIVINISSLVGSLQDNKIGGYFSYRESKAALNMLTKTLAADLRENCILVVALHPGWVQTEMGGADATFTVHQSCKALVNVIFEMNEQSNGLFFNYDGKQLPW